jgi:DNA-binding CsgD family transcriptional regulator
LVRERTSELEIKSKAVEELNVALKVLLHQVQEDKEHLEQRFVINVNKLVLPYLEKMKKGRLNEEQNSYLDIIRANLKGIMSPFLHNVQQFNLTQRETQVANLIKDGRTTKEIAEVVGVALDAVNSYRNSIRLKLGLNKKKVNLQAYLQSLR